MTAILMDGASVVTSTSSEQMSMEPVWKKVQYQGQHNTTHEERTCADRQTCSKSEIPWENQEKSDKRETILGIDSSIHMTCH